MSLFREQPQMGRGSASFIVSTLVHGIAASAVFFGLVRPPQVVNPAFNKRYEIRHVALNAAEPALASSGGALSRRLGGLLHRARPEIAEKEAAKPATYRKFPRRPHAAQTLVEPDLPPNLLLDKEIPTPAMLLWAQQRDKIRMIVPPPPHPATAADVEPSLAMPNQETTLADLNIASVNLSVPLPVLAPSNTSPIRVQAPTPEQAPPSISSRSSTQAVPAAAISVSDLRMKQGTIPLPPLNEIALEDAPATPALVLLVKSVRSGMDGLRSENGESAAAKGEGGPKPAGGKSDADKNGAAAQGAAASGKNAEAGDGHDSDTTLITYSKTGQFGVVVVGSSLDDEFPELIQIWGGRIAYTVYLQVGDSRNWVLQYSLPRGVEAPADGGNASPLEAPWAYSIVKPHLIPALLNADAMLLHGRINAAGKFEALELVYPPHTPQGTLVLNSLARWQFRPAKLNGGAVAVEVVLAIPNEQE